MTHIDNRREAGVKITDRAGELEAAMREVVDARERFAAACDHGLTVGLSAPEVAAMASHGITDKTQVNAGQRGQLTTVGELPFQIKGVKQKVGAQHISILTGHRPSRRLGPDEEPVERRPRRRTGRPASSAPKRRNASVHDALRSAGKATVPQLVTATGSREDEVVEILRKLELEGLAKAPGAKSLLTRPWKAVATPAVAG